ncbi:MAG TPA: TolC family protein [Pseudomonadales bacterium]
MTRARPVRGAFGALVMWLLTQMPAEAVAQPRQLADEPTTLAAVAASAIEHFPQILAAEADIVAKSNLVLAAQGSFDPRIDGSLGGRGGAYYDSQVLDTTIVQPLLTSNARVFAGYRNGNGEFPAYDSGSLTRAGGEARVGFALSLLRDRDIDARRAAVSGAMLDVQVEREQLTAERLRVMQQAYVAYAQWLIAARLHASYEDLLDIAVERGAALERRVESGDAAEILLVENRQAELQRRGLVVDAQRQIDMAAELLALYLRDDAGNPLLPRYDPALELPAEDPAVVGADISTMLPQVLERHPDIAVARLAQDQAALDKRLADNLARPQLDLRVYAARDFGGGPLQLAGTDNVADVTFSIPLRTREARGRAGAAQADIAALAQRIRMLGDQVEADLYRARVNLDATRTMEDFALQELEASRTLAAAERQRFDSGLSDFFLLNQRERQVGEAELKRWQAQLAHQMALANFYATGMHFAGLGADPAQIDATAPAPR